MHETPRETPPITIEFMLTITIDELFLHVTIPGTKLRTAKKTKPFKAILHRLIIDSHCM